METAIIHIVEDNKIIKENVSKFISFHEEFEIGVVVGSTEEFLAKPIQMSYNQIHVLLLDIGLPGISGVDAIPLILDKYPELNIVMLTTYEEEDLILKSICNGACSYISKRVKLDEIVDALRIVVNGGSYMSPSIAREIVNHLMGGRISKATILSDRQKVILESLMDGNSYQYIATELGISVETVRSHIKKMYKLLNVNNKTEAIKQYMMGYIK